MSSSKRYFKIIDALEEWVMVVYSRYEYNTCSDNDENSIHADCKEMYTLCLSSAFSSTNNKLLGSLRNVSSRYFNGTWLISIFFLDQSRCV